MEISNLTQAQCASTGNVRRVWAEPEYGANHACLVLPNEPHCEEAGWTRVNHLGNGRDGVPLNYTWTLPYFPSGNEKFIVVRIRYSLSVCLSVG